tara:strand:+ start:566 stop:745 length:180 start_codon:yes stop_codon:yes gene_type:complete
LHSFGIKASIFNHQRLIASIFFYTNTVFHGAIIVLKGVKTTFHTVKNNMKGVGKQGISG